MASNLNFTNKELQELLNDKNSGVKLVHGIKHIGLHPFHLNDFNAGIKETINGGIAQYDEKFGGILLCYRKPKVLPSSGAINNESCFIHLDIEAEFYVFCPEVGRTVKAIVNKISRDHVGCLVHKIFNVSILRPKDDIDGNWIGRSVMKNQEILITITYTDLWYIIPYIKGEIIKIFKPPGPLIPLEEDSGISTCEDLGKATNHLKNKHRESKKDEPSSYIDLVNKDKYQTLTKNKKNVISNDVVQEESNDDSTQDNVSNDHLNQKEESIKSTKKRKRNSLSEELLSPETSNENIKLKRVKTKTSSILNSEIMECDDIKSKLLNSVLKESILKTTTEQSPSPMKKKLKVISDGVANNSTLKKLSPIKTYKTPNKRQEIQKYCGENLFENVKYKIKLEPPFYADDIDKSPKYGTNSQHSCNTELTIGSPNFSSTLLPNQKLKKHNNSKKDELEEPLLSPTLTKPIHHKIIAGDVPDTISYKSRDSTKVGSSRKLKEKNKDEEQICISKILKRRGSVADDIEVKLNDDYFKDLMVTVKKQDKYDVELTLVRQSKSESSKIRNDTFKKVKNIAGSKTPKVRKTIRDDTLVDSTFINTVHDDSPKNLKSSVEVLEKLSKSPKISKRRKSTAGMSTDFAIDPMEKCKPENRKDPLHEFEQIPTLKSQKTPKQRRNIVVDILIDSLNKSTTSSKDSLFFNSVQDGSPKNLKSPTKDVDKLLKTPKISKRRKSTADISVTDSAIEQMEKCNLINQKDTLNEVQLMPILKPQKTPKQRRNIAVDVLIDSLNKSARMVDTHSKDSLFMNSVQDGSPKSPIKNMEELLTIPKISKRRKSTADISEIDSAIEQMEKYNPKNQKDTLNEAELIPTLKPQKTPKQRRSIAVDGSIDPLNKSANMSEISLKDSIFINSVQHGSLKSPIKDAVTLLKTPKIPKRRKSNADMSVIESELMETCNPKNQKDTFKEVVLISTLKPQKTPKRRRSIVVDGFIDPLNKSANMAETSLKDPIFMNYVLDGSLKNLKCPIKDAGKLLKTQKISKRRKSTADMSSTDIFMNSVQDGSLKNLESPIKDAEKLLITPKISKRRKSTADMSSIDFTIDPLETCNPKNQKDTLNEVEQIPTLKPPKTSKPRRSIAVDGLIDPLNKFANMAEISLKDTICTNSVQVGSPKNKKSPIKDAVKLLKTPKISKRRKSTADMPVIESELMETCNPKNQKETLKEIEKMSIIKSPTTLKLKRIMEADIVNNLINNAIEENAQKNEKNTLKELEKCAGSKISIARRQSVSDARTVNPEQSKRRQTIAVGAIDAVLNDSPTDETNDQKRTKVKSIHISNRQYLRDFHAQLCKQYLPDSKI